MQVVLGRRFGSAPAIGRPLDERDEL